MAVFNIGTNAYYFEYMSMYASSLIQQNIHLFVLFPLVSSYAFPKVSVLFLMLPFVNTSSCLELTSQVATETGIQFSASFTASLC